MATTPEPQTHPVRSRSGATLKRHAAKTDMTPMVDLGFLLIAFFVMTTEMNKPAVTRLIMPKETKQPGTTVRKSNALTLLIGGGKMHYYFGDWADASQLNEIFETTFSLKDGIGQVIRDRQAWLDQAKISEEGRDGLVFMIKPGPSANYQQVIDALDEMQINGVKKYMIVSPDKEELRLVSSSQ